MRSFENGRQVSFAITRKASQAFKVPRLMHASVPPATAASAIPERTIWKASPMAWVAEEHALTTPKDGPRRPTCIDTWLAGAFGISFGMVSG